MHDAGATVGHQLRTRRLALGMTQAHLAKLAGISQGSIARIETGNAGEVQASTLIGLVPEAPPSPKGPRTRARTSAKAAKG